MPTEAHQTGISTAHRCSHILARRPGANPAVVLTDAGCACALPHSALGPPRSTLPWQVHGAPDMCDDYCALCGTRCRNGRQSLLTAFGGKGLPSDQDVQRLVPKDWLERHSNLELGALPVRRGAGYLHNEAKSTGRSCYRAVNGMWACLGQEQA